MSMAFVTIGRRSYNFSHQDYSVATASSDWTDVYEYERTASTHFHLLRLDTHQTFRDKRYERSYPATPAYLVDSRTKHAYASGNMYYLLSSRLGVLDGCLYTTPFLSSSHMSL
jgi:hypothetical protein